MTKAKDLIKRRNLVFELRQQGIKIEDIAKTVDISTRQVDEDIAALRKQGAFDLMNQQGWEKLAEHIEQERIRKRQIWKVLTEKGAKNNEKLNAVKLLQEEANMDIRRSQIGGILPKDDSGIPLQSMEGGQKAVQTVNIYQTLLLIKQQERKVQEDMKKKEKVVEAKIKPKAPETKTKAKTKVKKAKTKAKPKKKGK